MRYAKGIVMSNFEEYNKYTKLDVVKDVLFTVVAAVLFMAYWCFTLLVISIILLNVWHVRLENIVVIAACLTLISTVVYVIRLIKRRVKEYGPHHE